MMKRLSLKQDTKTGNDQAKEFKYSKMGFSNTDEMKQMSNEKKQELAKKLEDENNIMTKADMKLAQRLLDPTTPYNMEIVECMKSERSRRRFGYVYKEMKHRQIEATAHICNMILQLICTAICDKQEGSDFNQELVKEDSNTNDMDVSKFREIGSEIASKLCIYSEETEKEHTKGASTDSKKRVTVYSLIIRFYAYIGDIDNAIRQLQKFREFARQRLSTGCTFQ